MTVRLQDIAHQLNLSVSTISLALRNSPQIGEETKERVRQAALDLGYVHRVRHPLAVDLRHVTFINPYATTNYFYSDVLHGAEAECRRHGIALHFVQLEGELNIQDLMRYGDGHGILLAGSIPERIVREVKQLQLPTVLIDNNLPHLGLDRVLIENVGGAYQITEYLIAAGHRRIAIMQSGESVPSFRERLQGCHMALEEAQLTPVLIPNSTTPQLGDAEKALLSMLQRRDSMTFSALITMNDEQAIGAIRMFQDHGYRVPEDISVTGFDDVMVAQVVRPALTTCRVPRDLLGQSGVHFLMQRAADPSAPIQAIVHTVTLVERNSVRHQRKTAQE
jgi:DNA-binding LacI/PurR family transcriptional regulator